MPSVAVLCRGLLACSHVRVRRERGASAVEYGLLISGVAALIVSAVLLFGGSVTDLFTGTCDTVQAARSAGTC
ncbi:MAG: Flp family type IVb pilin [Nocardioides sp.]|nr:Flp family type IVb pilin [Nocardioides sp.]